MKTTSIGVATLMSAFAAFFSPNASAQKVHIVFRGTIASASSAFFPASNDGVQVGDPFEFEVAVAPQPTSMSPVEYDVLTPRTFVRFETKFEPHHPTIDSTLRVTDGGSDVLSSTLTTESFVSIAFSVVDPLGQLLASDDLLANGSSTVQLGSAVSSSCVVNLDHFGHLFNVALESVQFDVQPGPLVGQIFCSSRTNSIGLHSRLDTSGSASAAQNDLTLRAWNLPPAVFGMFIASDMAANVQTVTGSEGILCLGGDIGRYNGPSELQLADAAGEFSLSIDTGAIRRSSQNVPALAGSVFVFQAWHRDTNASGQTSNFTDAVSLVFE